VGDRISCVALLGAVPQGAELHVISDDGDFESEITKAEIKPYLLNHNAGFAEAFQLRETLPRPRYDVERAKSRCEI
jgi:hypothetical protein